MYFKIYFYVFLFFKAFSQTSSSIIFETSLHASNFDEEICIDIDSIQIPGYWDLYLICKLRLMIIKTIPCSYFCYVEDVHREDIKQIINAVNSPIIITIQEMWNLLKYMIRKRKH